MNGRNLSLVVVALMLTNVAGCAGLGTERSDAYGDDGPVAPRIWPAAQGATLPQEPIRPAAYEAPGEALPPQLLPPSPTSAERMILEPECIELDLASALAIVGGQNPQIAFAAARYREAYAGLELARTLWLPSIRAGMSYHHHDGHLQASDGTIVNVNRSSLQAGLGVNGVGAGTTVIPGIAAQFHTSDALFQPKIAAETSSALAHDTEAVSNDTLLETALAYLNLLRASQALRIAEETRDNAQKLADVTDQFARSGQGSQADADRSMTELVRRRNNVSRAEEASRVAAARLAELLSFDPAARIIPLEPAIVAIELVPPGLPLQELVATGLSNRPELRAAQHLVAAALFRYRREKHAPLVPSVLLGVSHSGFGGGLGSTVNNVRGRFDFDAGVFWEVRSLGFGERANRDATTARYDQTLAEQARIMDSVAREVVEAAVQIEARGKQIALAEAGVRSAQNSYKRDSARIRAGQGLPIEVLQSLQALDEASREYLRTLTDYNEAQFRLQRALGWPIH